MSAARTSLDLDQLKIDLWVGDARDWLSQDTHRFDCVVEDIFVVHQRRAVKPNWLVEGGYDLLVKRLTRGGILIRNTIDEATRVARRLRRLRPHLLELQVDGYANRIFAASDQELHAREVCRTLALDPVLDPILPRLRLRTRATD